jgi:O-antigen/teichoic acid export membrane protein
MARVAEETVESGGSRLAENTLALAVAGALQMVFTLIQLGVLSRYLGGEHFGLYVALRGFSLLLTTVILIGFPQVLVRYLPSFQRRGRRGSATGWFFFFSSAVIVLGAVVLWAALRWTGIMPDNLVVSGLSGETARWMILASVALALKLILYGGFSGLREMRLHMIFELAFQVLFTTLILLWRSRLDVELLFTAMFALNALVWAAGIPVYLAIVRKSFSRGRRSGASVAGRLLGKCPGAQLRRPRFLRRGQVPHVRPSAGRGDIGLSCGIEDQSAHQEISGFSGGGTPAGTDEDI